jgi:hypothetical protein
VERGSLPSFPLGTGERHGTSHWNRNTPTLLASACCQVDTCRLYPSACTSREARPLPPVWHDPGTGRHRTVRERGRATPMSVRP